MSILVGVRKGGGRLFCRYIGRSLDIEVHKAKADLSRKPNTSLGPQHLTKARYRLSLSPP